MIYCPTTCGQVVITIYRTYVLVDNALSLSVTSIIGFLGGIKQKGESLAKVKTPFLSLDSRGSIGGSITAQDGIAGTILRHKPFPKDPHSLSQAYRRWLYQNYAYLWTQQSDALKAQYRTLGTRYHLTAFQYWMKVMLKTQPYIAGIWHLDEAQGAQAYDSSLHYNTGTIFGASPIKGAISFARYFDGLNDYLNLGNASIFNPELADFSVEALFCVSYNNGGSLFEKGSTTEYSLDINSHKIAFFIRQGVRYVYPTSTTLVDDGKFHHVVGLWQPSTKTARLYLDGVLEDTKTNALIIPPITNTLNLIVGSRTTISPPWFKGTIDNICLYSRLLDLTEIQRHSERRYPLQ
jgi:hypothetical protein